MSDNDFARAAYELPERPSEAQGRIRSAATEFDPTTAPLPNELPAQPDFSLLPERILHSGAVETLIGQNEDLMARLKVNIRRCSVLERQVIEQEQSASDLRRINVSLTAQIQILCEKEGSLKDRVEAAERARADMQSRLRRLEAFYRRTLAWVRPRFKRAVRAEAALYGREAELASLKGRMSGAVTRLQEIEGSSKRDQALLVENYETAVSEARAETERLRHERAYLKERSDRLEETRKKLAESENAGVLLERQRLDLERKLNESVSTLQSEMAGYRREAKRLAAELAEAKRAEERAEAQRQAVAARLARAEDQFESLRAVWEEAQKKRDALAARNDALARVNQELARKLRDGRSSSTGASIAGAGFSQAMAIDDPDRAAILAAARGEGFERVDALLAEIESGFSRQARPAAEAAPSEGAEQLRARALSFVDERADEGADDDLPPTPGSDRARDASA